MRIAGCGGSGAAAVALAAALSSAAGAGHTYHDWTTWFASGTFHFDNASSAGVISGSSTAFTPSLGAWGLPTAITPSGTFAGGLGVHGSAAPGGSVTFIFSPQYAWGTGGRLVLGNIHNYYEYTLSAWDANNTPLDVNSWPQLAEYPSSAPGTVGYFSTSTTSRSAAGLSSKFFVLDSSASANSGQGGVLLLDGLVNVAKLQLTLSSSSLAPNDQQSDFLLLFVGTPTCPNDLTGDGAIDGADLGVLLAQWGTVEDGDGDLDGNGTIDGSDLGVLLASWGEICP